MNFPRRHFLGSSLVVLGSTLLDALTTPLWKWKHRLSPPGDAAATAPQLPRCTFVDVASEAGLNVPNVWGGVDHKRYIIEAKGSGLAFFDYDNDGWLDIYLTNGTRLDANWPPGKAPTSHLYKNNRDGTFTDVTEKSGLARTGWQTGVCVGDYDNDGWDDLFCCFWGHNILFHNNGDGTFTDVTRKAGVYDEQIRWGAGCTLLDYDRDGHLDLFVCNYIKLDPAKTPAARRSAPCQWKGIPVMCGPRGLPGDTNVLYHNNGDGTFTDVSRESRAFSSPARAIPSPRSPTISTTTAGPTFTWPWTRSPAFCSATITTALSPISPSWPDAPTARTATSRPAWVLAVGDYDCDGWFDIFKTNFADDTCNLYHNNGDGTFTDVTFSSGIGINNRYVAWGCGFVDYDNDGWPDLMQINGHVYPEIEGHDIGQTFKNPRLVYKNLGNGRFKDVSAEMGPGISERFSSRGAAFGDYDNDGDIDALILNMNDLPSLLRNDGGNKQNWIKIKLIGTKCNRTANRARTELVGDLHAQSRPLSNRVTGGVLRDRPRSRYRLSRPSGP